MKNLTICDMHCDTATKIYDNNEKLSLTDIFYTQFFAIFIAPEYYNSPQKRFFDVLNNTYNEFLKNSDKIKFCKTLSDIEKDKINAFLSAEGGEIITDLKLLEILYTLGIRMLTLTWNNDNLIGGANGSSMGLTPFGEEVVKKMNELGIIIDLSHASEKTFFDVCKLSKKPIVLSHSNSYSICPHPRNITDAQFEEIKRINGCVVINFYPPFLNKNKTATIYDIVAHIEYFLSLGGENNIGIGSDFDGTDYLADGIASTKDIYKIFDILASKGVCDDILKKIAYKNIYRVMGICL